MSNSSVDTRALVEGGILSGLTVLLTLLAIYIPLLWLVVQLIQALPVMILTVRHGIKPGLIASVVTAILIFMLGNPLAALSLFSVAPAVLVMGWGIKEGKKAAGCIALGTFSGFLAKLAVIALSIKVLKINFLLEFEEQMKAGVATALEFYKASGIDEAKLQELVHSSEQLLPVLLIMIPAFLVVIAAAEAFLNFWLTAALLRRLGQGIEEGLPPLKYWDLPKTFIYGWMLSLASYWAGAYYFGGQALTYKFGANCFMLFSSLLFLQGFAVLSFFLVKHNVPRLLRILIGIVVLFVPLLNLIMLYIGGFDMYANFRKLPRKE
ncbi:MAG TPA: hypothetical protein DEA44_16100 [Firmicutes bacterium]|nr:hypothetical protein [Bacillota bacterium]